MNPDDIDYYRRRAIEERMAAADASQANIALIHEELALLYEALVRHPELRPAATSPNRPSAGSSRPIAGGHSA